MEVDDMKIEILTLGSDDYVLATGDDRNQESNQGCLGDIPQVQEDW